MIKEIKIADQKTNKIVATIEQEFTAYEVLVRLKEAEARKKFLLRQLEDVENEIATLNALTNSNKALFDNVQPPNIVKTGE